MTNRFALSGAACAAVLAISCSAKVEPPAPVPRIERFTASASTVAKGTPVTLSYQVTNATEVVLFDTQGVEVPTTGELLNGTATVTPDRSTFYLLRVRGEGGSDSAYVQIAVDQPLERLFLVAVPPQIEAGAEVQLLYSATGASAVSIVDDSGAAIPTSAATGVVTVQPSRSTRYTLRAGPAAAPVLTTAVDVLVRPVLRSFRADPAAARTGETMKLSWETSAANELELSEATFGVLHRTMVAAEVELGSFDWVVPTMLPGSDAGTSDAGVTLPVVDGQPLRFQLTVKSTQPSVTLTRQLESVVGAGPRIDTFAGPTAVTQGKAFTLSWKTTNATRVQLFADGALIHEPAPASPEVVAGSRTLTMAGAGTTFELVAWSFNGLSVRSTKRVESVAPPEILTFVLTPSISAAGVPATAMWTTRNASEVQLRMKQSATVFSTTAAGQVGAGTTQIRPSLSGIYELVARNAAGEFVTAEQRVTVGSPQAIAALPSPAAPGQTVTINWDTGGSALEVHGIPTTMPQVIPSSSTFVDLRTGPPANTLFFAETDDAVVALPSTLGFRFPAMGRIHESFWVSTNGFVAFTQPGTLSTNTDLLTAPPGIPMFAPFWDDLEITPGQVSWRLDGEEFPRRLIIQWSDVARFDDATARLTFQVQLYESGQVRFAYSTLTDSLSMALGQAATVGFSLGAGEISGQHGFNTVSVAPDLELLWFNTPAASGSFQVVADDSRVYALFTRTGLTTYRSAAIPVMVIGPGAFSVNEAMPIPDPAFPMGTWIEISNPKLVDSDLGGVTLVSTGNDAGYTFPPGTLVPAKGFLVVGETTNLAANGDAGVTHVISNVPLAQADTLSLMLGPTMLSSLSWTTAMPGVSVQASRDAIAANGQAITCTRTQTYNGNGNIGTPGRGNELCFDYVLQPIAGSFEDLTTGGTELLASGSDYTAFGTVALPMPFTYFGQSFTSFNVAIPGFITFGPALTAAYDVTNDALPSTSAPNGVVAIFWDRIVRNTNGKLLMARRSDRTIISWQDFRIYASSGSSMNFQIKLFDTGIIEMHYGTMTAGNKPNETTGSTATTWIEKPDGTAALPANINTVNGIQPNSGFRFSPRQP